MQVARPGHQVSRRRHLRRRRRRRLDYWFSFRRRQQQKRRPPHFPLFFYRLLLLLFILFLPYSGAYLFGRPCRRRPADSPRCTSKQAPVFYCGS